MDNELQNQSLSDTGERQESGALLRLFGLITYKKVKTKFVSSILKDFIGHMI